MPCESEDPWMPYARERCRYTDTDNWHNFAQHYVTVTSDWRGSALSSPFGTNTERPDRAWKTPSHTHTFHTCPTTPPFLGTHTKRLERAWESPYTPTPPHMPTSPLLPWHTR
eukprot:365094-Chlamydomonas_euryale.AAC.7